MADGKSGMASTATSVSREPGTSDGSTTHVEEEDDDLQTEASSRSSGSTDTMQPPAVPNNTPASRSESSDVGEDPTSPPSSPDLASAVAALNLHAGGPPSSTSSESDYEEGKAHLRGPLRSELDLHKQLFKAPPVKKTKKNRVTWDRHAGRFKRIGNRSPPEEHYHEYDTWAKVAEEDVERGLQRLVMAAKDQARISDAKTPAEWYSERVAELLSKQELKFDEKALK
ncbi:uncharacterized protein LTR77_006263 [Saxophila tyrrhenica]|uniref:Uncharacterized protein n=1 Tax=Saxophila tyrrhenica TaxID=1690608 RepID=A0AAV9PAV3_9PEZI|nr:hypothetical protein LTR77_006263 [Saxophila tyrrhenica]